MIINLCFLLLIELGVREILDVWMVYDIEMVRYARWLKVESPNPLIGHVHRPDVRAELMGVDVAINSHGFRDVDYDLKKGDDHRVVFLGDSLTLGWGVEFEETFESELERMLNADAPTEVINLGVGNYNTQQEVNAFIEKGLRFSPDQVVLFYFINDAEETPHRSRWSLLEHSELVSLLWSRFRVIRSMISPEDSYLEYYAQLYAEGSKGWEATKSSLRQLAELCGDRGIEFQVIILPDFHELQTYPFEQQHGKLMQFLRSEKIDALDLAPAFAEQAEAKQLWVAPDDAHPNALANKMIAEYSVQFLRAGVPR